MTIRTAEESIIKYLQDAVAAEQTFETQLRTLADEGDDPTVQNLFAQHAEETKTQWERLQRRLEGLGGESSTTKSILGHIFGMAPKVAQLSQDTADKNTQNLIMAYAVESSELAMYEALIAAAREAGDAETERLAEEIQAEERMTAEKIWRQISTIARESFSRVSDRESAARGTTINL